MVNGYTNYTKVEDTRILGYKPLASPYHIKQQIGLSERAVDTVLASRQSIASILKRDGRKLVVLGPCSVHDVDAAMDYADKLRSLRDKVGSIFELVMRAYFEKPRTTVGWKGLIYEPYLDGKENINAGLAIARNLLRGIAELGMPAGTEFLDPFVPQYIGDLISWAAIGARTAESPQHRQMASGLSMPIGFKNGTQGNIDIAINAMIAAMHQGHSFFGMDPNGVPAIVSTRGNHDVHLILRGGCNGTNYNREQVEAAQQMLSKTGLEGKVMVDCSHGNSSKDYRRQPLVFEEVIRQIADGNQGIIGLMIESNIREGSQQIPKKLDELEYGQSVTDSCIGWDTTEQMIIDAFKTLSRQA